MRRETSTLNSSRVIISFLIAVFLLIFAFLIGYMVSFMNYQRISSIQDTIKIDILSTQLAGELLGECNKEAFNIFSENLDQSGSLLFILEDRFGKDDVNVLEQKKQYTLLEIQHFLAVKDYSRRCSDDIDTILFFYSNQEDYMDQAENIGKVLNRIKGEKESDLMIYSFDYDLDIKILTLMKHIYSVNFPNTIVINEVFVLENVNNINDIRPHIEGTRVKKDVIVLN
ncbi:MAG: hypothetical protein ABIH59_02510 [archaeon]